MKLKKTIIIGLLVVAVGEVAYFSYKTFSKFEQIETEKMLQKQLKSTTLKGIDIQSILENENTTIAVNYPLTKNEKVNESIQTMVFSRINSFKAKSATGENKRTQKDEFFMPFDTYRLSNDIVSFKYDIYSNFQGKANGENEVYTQTFNMQTGQKISIMDLLKNNKDLNPLSQYILKKLSMEEVYKNSAEEMESLKEGLAAKFENFSNFVLDDKNITFYFKTYQLGSKANSMKYYTIPLAYMGDILKQEYLTSDLKKEANDSPEKIQSVDNGMEVVDKSLAKKKLVALTFDDGPDPNTTPGLLKYLKKEEVPVTFFVLGSRVEFYGNIIQDAAKDGNQIGSHTFNHLNLPTVSISTAKSEINKTSNLIEKAIGVKPNTVRPPYGATNPTLDKMYHASVVMWDVDSLDWKTKNPDMIYDEVMKNVKDGSIVLMHDIYQTSVDGAKKVIPALKEKGYTFVTVNQLIELRSKLENGKHYFGVSPDGKVNG